MLQKRCAYRGCLENWGQRPRSFAAWACLAALTACSDSPTEEVQGPAQQALSGFGVLPHGRIGDGSHAPQALAEAFREFGRQEVEAALLPSPGAPVLVLSLPLDEFEPVLLGGGKGLTAAAALKQVQAVVGSGFVSEVDAANPVGLLQIEGRMLSPVQPHGYTRILGVGPDGMGVVGHREYNAGMYDSALQAGPGVVEAGLLDISERDLSRPSYLRAFAATCGPVAVVGASLEPTHLFTLGQRLLACLVWRNRACLRRSGQLGW